MFKVSSETKYLHNLILISFFIICVILSYFYLFDYGVHIEEKFHRLNGHYWLNVVAKKLSLSGLELTTKLKIEEIYDYTLNPVWLYNKYGIVLDLPAALIEIIFNIEEIKNVYYLKHFLSFSIFLLSSFFFYKILKERFKNFYLNFSGLILFVSTPRILGDSFLYKDVLFLSLFVFAIYFFLKSLDKLEKKYLILFALFTALAISLRVFAILLPLIFLFILTLKVFNNSKFFFIFEKILFYFFFLTIFTYLFWPYLWDSPINNFILIFSSMEKSLVDIKILFANEFVSNYFLPDIYILKWIFISNPILQTIFFILGYSLCCARILNRYFNLKEDKIFNDLWRGKKELIDLTFFLIIFIYFFSFLFVNAPFYNGWRLLYFFNIFLIYFAIYFFDRLLLNLNRNILKKVFLMSLVFFTLASNIYSIIIFHPFQSLFFNILLNNKQINSYEGDYHGISSKHFFEYISLIDKKNKIKIAVASHTPLHRGLESLPSSLKNKFLVIGQEYEEADYIYKNNISEVDSKINKKYEIPKNFSKIYELKKGKTKIYEIYKFSKNLK